MFRLRDRRYDEAAEEDELQEFPKPKPIIVNMVRLSRLRLRLADCPVKVS